MVVYIENVQQLLHKLSVMIGFATNRQYQGNVKTVGSNALLGCLANLLMRT